MLNRLLTTGLATAAALATLSLLAAPARARAQELPSSQISPNLPQAPPPTAATEPAPLPQAPTIVATTNLVNMVFSVQDKHGGFVPNLPQADFSISEDGRPQTVSFFSQENQLPLTLGLLLDTSPSQSRVLGEEQAISDQFFQQVITPKDLAFVIGFDVNTALLQDLTSSKRLLSAAIDQAHIGGGGAVSMINPGTFPTPGGGGATHLWDAIYLACHDELAHQVGRKAIVVVTDGGEQGSTYTDQDALRAALESNTIVFAVIASDRGFAGYGSFGAGPGPSQLAHIAEQTGGRSVEAGNNMAKAFDEIQQELRSQYSLGYTPPPSPPGAYHLVKITMSGPTVPAGAKVRTRTGYYTGTQEP